LNGSIEKGNQQEIREKHMIVMKVNIQFFDTFDVVPLSMILFFTQEGKYNVKNTEKLRLITLNCLSYSQKNYISFKIHSSKTHPYPSPAFPCLPVPPYCISLVDGRD
jgi:hypothetical protein